MAVNQRSSANPSENPAKLAENPTKNVPQSVPESKGGGRGHSPSAEWLPAGGCSDPTERAGFAPHTPVDTCTVISNTRRKHNPHNLVKSKD